MQRVVVFGRALRGSDGGSADRHHPAMVIRVVLLVLIFGVLVACTSEGEPQSETAPLSAPPAASEASEPAEAPAAEPAAAWTLEREPFAPRVPVTDVSALLASGDGSPWVAVGSASDSPAEAPRPVAWTAGTSTRWNAPVVIDEDSGEGASAFDVARKGSTFIAVGERWEGGTSEAMVWRSTDGEQWERVDVSAGEGSGLFTVVASKGGFWAAGSRLVDGNSDAMILKSPDGEQWTPVELETPDGDRVYVSDVLENGSVAVGSTRGAHSRPLVWHRQGDQFVLGKVKSRTPSTSVSTVVRYRGALHAFGVEGAATNLVAYWRSDDGGKTWQRKKASGAYLNETLTDLTSGGLDVGDAVATRKGIYLALSEGPARLATSRNLKRWELIWPATPKGSYYVPLFDGMTTIGTDVFVAGDFLGGAFLWRYDASGFRWFELDQRGEAFNRDQAATTLRAATRDGDATIVGGAGGASKKTDARVSILWRGAGTDWKRGELKGRTADQWFNVLLETPQGVIGAGGRQPRSRSSPAVWDVPGGDARRRSDAAFELPKGWSGFLTDGVVADGAVVLAGIATDGSGVQRSVAWVRAGKKKWGEIDLEQFLAGPSRRNPEVLPTASTAACALNGRGILIGSIVGKGAAESRPVLWSGKPRAGALWRADRRAFPKGSAVEDCFGSEDGVIAVGDVDGYPAVWTSDDGRTWDGGREALGGDLEGQVTVVAGNGEHVYAVGGVQEAGVLKLRVWRRNGGAWEALPDDPTFVAQDTIEVAEAVVGESGELTIVGALGTTGAVWRGGVAP